jgi:hypothetical protein
MSLIAFLALAAASPTDAVDAANLAYTQCLFATSRAASQARLSVSAFEEKLARSCIAQQNELKRFAGESVDNLATAARREVVDAYRKALELEPQLKRIAEMCRAQPEQCRH